jgi:hypothetical protein
MQAVVNEFSRSICYVCNNNIKIGIEDAINLLNLSHPRIFCMNDEWNIRKWQAYTTSHYKFILIFVHIRVFVCLHVCVREYVWLCVCFLFCVYIGVLLNWTYFSKIGQTIESNEWKVFNAVAVAPRCNIIEREYWKNICNLSTLFKQSWFHGMSIDVFYIFSASKRFSSKWMCTAF